MLFDHLTFPGHNTITANLLPVWFDGSCWLRENVPSSKYRDIVKLNYIELTNKICCYISTNMYVTAVWTVCWKQKICSGRKRTIYSKQNLYVIKYLSALHQSQEESSPSNADVNIDEVVRFTKSMVTSGNDPGVQGSSSWMLGHLYLSLSSVAQSRASGKDYYHKCLMWSRNGSKTDYVWFVYHFIQIVTLEILNLDEIIHHSYWNISVIVQLLY